MNWHGLNEWQQWILGIGCSLAAACIIWLCTRLFRKERKSAQAQGIIQNASPVMTQNFQPTINIHTPGAADHPLPDPSLRVKLAFGCLVDGPELSEQMLLFTVANPNYDRPVQLVSLHLPLKGVADLVFPYLDGERRMPCIVEPGTKFTFWVSLSAVETTLRSRNYTGPIHAVATDAPGNEHVSNSVNIGH